MIGRGRGLAVRRRAHVRASLARHVLGLLASELMPRKNTTRSKRHVTTT
jgi:hypothetical protein